MLRQVLLPIRGWTTMAERGLQLGLELSPDVAAVCINLDDEEVHSLQQRWETFVEMAYILSSPVGAGGA